MKKLLGILFMLGSLSVLAEGEGVSKDETTSTKQSKEMRYFGPGTVIDIVGDDGKVREAIISDSRGESIVVKYTEEEETGLKIHGNWVTMYKMEYFKNEGSLGNTRPVNELVFGEGTLNFGDTGFNLFYTNEKSMV